MGLKSVSSDTIKSAYVYLILFLHLIPGYRRKQAYSYSAWNNRENKHIGICRKLSLERVIFFIINK